MFLFRNMVSDSKIPEDKRAVRLMVSPQRCTWLEAQNHCHGDRGNHCGCGATGGSDKQVRLGYCQLDHQMCSSLIRDNIQDTSLIQQEKILTLRISDRMSMIKADLEWDVDSL